MAKITSLATATASNAVERAHFSDVVAQEMVKAARASPTPPSAAVIQTLAAVVVGVKKAPVEATNSIKAGCYTKAYSCPNHKWASGSWNWHSHGTKQGKAYCLSDADNHHVSCGGDVTDPWSQKWVDNTGESVVTYPSPGCYWKLTTCPNHPGWLTTPANGGSSTNWKKHGIDDQARCIGSAWSHHKLCGLPETDTDKDGYPDCIDKCPNDANKHKVGSCGCGVADADADGDGTPNCNDDCPADASKTTQGVCGCGVADTDTDADGTADCTDDCPDWPYACSEDGLTYTVAPGESIQLALDTLPAGGMARVAIIVQIGRAHV